MEISTAKLIGLKIREFRKIRDLTQEQLAELIGSTGSYVGRLERGERNVKLHTLEKVAQALTISIFELFNFQFEPKAQTNPSILEAVSLLLEQNEAKQQKAIKILKIMFND